MGCMECLNIVLFAGKKYCSCRRSGSCLQKRVVDNIKDLRRATKNCLTFASKQFTQEKKRISQRLAKKFNVRNFVVTFCVFVTTSRIFNGFYVRRCHDFISLSDRKVCDLIKPISNSSLQKGLFTKDVM